MELLEAYHDYTVGVVRLMIRHVWHLAHHARDTVPVHEALDHRVDIMRKTIFYDGRHPALGLDPPVPEWDRMKDDLEARITNHRDADSTDSLEDECWRLLAPYIEPTLEGVSVQIIKNKDRPYRCWSYIVSKKAPDAIDLHFANAYQPDSPFHDCRRDLVATLLQVLCDAKASYPAVTRVQCDSWLNQYTPFLHMFPDSWRTTFVPSYYTGTYGWWGQYMNHRGAFHARNGAAFRRSKTHPYTCGLAQCVYDKVVNHLSDVSHELARI